MHVNNWFYWASNFSYPTKCSGASAPSEKLGLLKTLLREIASVTRSAPKGN